jgi:hypothetical protein
LKVDSFNPLILAEKLLPALPRRLLSSSTSRERSRCFALRFLSPSSGHSSTRHHPEELHFFLIFRSRAIFRFIAADPLPVPVFLEDFFRRRGVDAFAFFFARRRVPPLLDAARPN